MIHNYKLNKITSIIVTCFLLSFLNNGNLAFGQAPNTWTQKTNFGGSARWGLSAFSIGAKGYVGCGSTNAGSANDLWEYDQATNAWTQKANFPGTARYGAVGFAIGTKGYMGSGMAGAATNDFYEYDPALNTWTAKAAMPGVRSSATGFSIGSKAYVGLGYSGTIYLQDFYEFDPALNTWTVKANFPGTGRSYAPGICIGTNGYVGTGYTGTGNSDFYEYNPGTNVWTAKAAFPGLARWAASAFAVATKGYLGCGTSGGAAYLNDFYEYDPATNIWTAKANHGGGGIGWGIGYAIGTKGYFTAGYNTATYANLHYEYTAESGAALNFDGANDVVDLGNSINSVLDPINKITVEAWVKPTNNTYLGVIAGNYANPSNQMQFLLRRDNDEFAFWVDDGSGCKVVGSGISTSTVNVWQHVAGVWDGSKIMIYINGVLKGTTTGVTGASFASTANSLRLGTNNAGTPESFNGNIDELRIWTIARTQCEINTFANCEIATTATGLLANYHFNHGMDAANNATVTTLVNAASALYNGTLSNFALAGATSNWVAPGGVNSGMITPLAPPAVTAVPATTTICNGQSATLSGGGAVTYTWSGTVVNGTAFMPTATANYTVTGTAANTCTNTAVATINVNNCTPAAALNFDGVNDYINCGVSPALNLTGALTVEAWVRRNTIGTDDCIIGKDQFGANTGYSFWIFSNNKFSLRFGNTAYLSTSNIAAGAYNHLAATYNAGTLNLYLNGVLDASYTAVAAPVSNTGGLFIGTPQDAVGVGAYALAANVDEVRVWNIARTQCEINTFKNCEIASTATGLLANYHFNQGYNAVTNTATTLIDASASAFTGTLTNFALTGATSNWIAPGGVVSGSVTPASLTPAVTASATSAAICNGGSTTLNGGGASTYTWTGGVTNGVAFSPVNTATYTVVGTNAANGCTNSAVQAVTVNPLPVVTAAITNSVICEGSSTTLNGGGADTYTWTGGVTNGVAFTPLTSGSYTVSGTNTLTGCSSTNTAVESVSVNTLPVVTAAITNSVICEGATTTLNGGGADTYTWTGGVSNGVAFAPAASGSYTVTGTNTLTGCTSTNTAVESVTVNLLPIVTAAITNSVICNGATTTLNGGGADTYTWTGGVSNGVAFTPTATGSYTVTGTNTLTGCTSTNAAVGSVTVNANPVISAANGAMCANGSFTIVPAGANTYTISGGSAVVSPTANTSYSITGTSTEGCTGNTAIITVTVNPNPTVTAVSNLSLICTGQSVTLTANGANTYTWNTSATGANISVSPTVTTSYTVTGEDANGCNATASITQSVDACTNVKGYSSVIQVKLYPNPTSGTLTMELSTDAQVVIMSSTGQILSTEKYNSGLNQIDMGDLANGIYFLQVNQNDQVKTYKIVKH